jgi:Xaa-Pro aminopeptidase
LLHEIESAWCTPSFHPIVAAAKNAAHPHWRADNTPLHGFVVIDFGVVYKNYMSDMTRTIYVWQPSQEQINLYNLVLQAQEDSMAYIKPGRQYKDAHRVAAATLWSERKYFIHSLGHGIGTIIHEHPRISPKGKWVFKENMCITVEPGVYIEGKLGIRVEDTCLVTVNGCEQITKSTKKLLCF